MIAYACDGCGMQVTVDQVPTADFSIKCPVCKKPKRYKQLRLLLDEDGFVMVGKMKRLAECDVTKLLINALTVYYGLLQHVAEDGIVLLWSEGKEKPDVLELP